MMWVVKVRYKLRKGPGSSRLATIVLEAQSFDSARSLAENCVRERLAPHYMEPGVPTVFEGPMMFL